jgi:tRNA pseudouridine55 synthase
MQSVKIGHGGTLDPLATGVLIAGIGKGTKILQSFLECTKTYETIVLFGAQTDTYDRVGKILKRAEYKHITREMVEKALEQFKGEIMQLPPLFSALKMNGKPLYEYAREGLPIPREIQKRKVEVKEMELLEWYPGGTHEHQFPTEEAGAPEKDVANRLWKVEKEQEAHEAQADASLAVKKRKLEESQDELVTEEPASKRRASVSSPSASAAEPTMSGALDSPGADAGPPACKIRMTVTSGFYVRSLAHDLGQAVGSEAIMAELIRTRQGQFELGKNVLEYGDLEKGEQVWGPKVETMLDEWSEEYRPFAGSTAESNKVEVPTAAEAGEKLAEVAAENTSADEPSVLETVERAAEVPAAEAEIKA